MRLRFFYSYAESTPQVETDWIDGGEVTAAAPGEGPKWGWGMSMKGGDFVFDLRHARPMTFMKLVPVIGAEACETNIVKVGGVPKRPRGKTRRS